MVILVTGGAGFLGSHLCERLLNEGHEVLCLDNFFTGRRKNVAHLISNPNFELIRHDVVDSFKFEVDQIYNLACPASPVHYQFNPIKTVKTSVMGAINCLGLAKRVGARILQASTSEVYGDPEVHPQPESYRGNVNPIGLRACYDEGKRCAETLCFDYKRYYKMDVRVIRIFNTYGPNMQINDGRVITNFINQSLNNKNITIFGNGSQTRSFCYIDDLIEIITKIIEFKNKINQPINIGNPAEYTMKQLAKKIIKLTGKNSKIKYCKLPTDDPNKRCPDITYAKKFFLWSPKISLNDGLIKTIDYFKN